MRTVTRLAAVVAAGALITVGLAGAVDAGAAPTISVTPNPAVTGETVTVSSIEPCPVPGDTQFVELLIDGPDGDEILNTDADVAGDWTFTFPAGDPGTYGLTVSCVRVVGNDVYRTVDLVVEAAPTTTSSSTTSSTSTSTTSTSTAAAPTTSTTAPPAAAAAVAATPTFTG